MVQMLVVMDLTIFTKAAMLMSPTTLSSSNEHLNGRVPHKGQGFTIQTVTIKYQLPKGSTRKCCAELIASRAFLLVDVKFWPMWNGVVQVSQIQTT